MKHKWGKKGDCFAYLCLGIGYQLVHVLDLSIYFFTCFDRKINKYTELVSFVLSKAKQAMFIHLFLQLGKSGGLIKSLYKSTSWKIFLSCVSRSINTSARSSLHILTARKLNVFFLLRYGFVYLSV